VKILNFKIQKQIQNWSNFLKIQKYLTYKWGMYYIHDVLRKVVVYCTRKPKNVKFKFLVMIDTRKKMSICNHK
jgi:hypothetical protein